MNEIQEPVQILIAELIAEACHYLVGSPQPQKTLEPFLCRGYS